MMDQNLKHRLTGAIVLVSLAVIFIPVILEGPDNEWTPLSHGIPESPQLDYKARMDLSREIETPAAVKRNLKVEQKPAYKLAEPVRAKAAAPVPKPEPQLAAPEKTAVKAEALRGWYVQVGSFSSEKNASRLSKRLQTSGYDAVFQKLTSKKGDLYRVIVGPERSREIAQQARDQLADEFKLQGIVISDPG
ncbi:MAG: SPOR domain-containing protein [Gammaproteobacteria bacterium]